MVESNKHSVAMNIEAIDCVKRADTGKDTIIVVFDGDESAHGTYSEELNPDHYKAVREEIQDTMFQEEPPVGPKFVSTGGLDDEMKLRFVL